MNTEQEEYITLFCEGDGSISLNSGHSKFYSNVRFIQKERDVLDYIALIQAGGTFHQSPNGIWGLNYGGSKCIPLLEIFSKHAVGKHFTERLNEVLEYVGLPPATQHLLTLEGFVAFWDAEGSSGNLPALHVVQKDREILDLIVEQFSDGVTQTSSVHQWHLTGEVARKLVPEILNKSH